MKKIYLYCFFILIMSLFAYAKGSLGGSGDDNNKLNVSLDNWTQYWQTFTIPQGTGEIEVTNVALMLKINATQVTTIIIGRLDNETKTVVEWLGSTNNIIESDGTTYTNYTLTSSTISDSHLYGIGISAFDGGFWYGNDSNPYTDGEVWNCSYPPPDNDCVLQAHPDANLDLAMIVYYDEQEVVVSGGQGTTTVSFPVVGTVGGVLRSYNPLFYDELEQSLKDLLVGTTPTGFLKKLYNSFVLLLKYIFKSSGSIAEDPTISLTG